MEDGTDIFQWEGLELVLFQEIVEVLFQHLKDQTGVVLVGETLVGPDEIVVIRGLLGQPVQYGHLNLPLSRVGWMILQDLYCHYLVCSLFPTFDHLAKGSSPKELQHLILVGRGVEDLMLDHLIIPLRVGGIVLG